MQRRFGFCRGTPVPAGDWASMFPFQARASLREGAVDVLSLSPLSGRRGVGGGDWKISAGQDHDQ